MKLISIATLAIAATTNPVELMGSAFSSDVREFAAMLAATEKANPTLPRIEDYTAYSAGNVISDEGLIQQHGETLSLNDGNPFEESLEHIAEQAEQFEFVTVTHYFGGILTILYFTK